MVKSCSAYNCKNRQKKGCGLTFHGFPKDQVLRKKWISATRRIRFEPGPGATLCSLHFLDSDYQIRPNASYRYLKSDAIPSVFNFSSDPSIPPQQKQTEHDDSVHRGTDDTAISPSHSLNCSTKLETVEVAVNEARPKESKPTDIEEHEDQSAHSSVYSDDTGAAQYAAETLVKPSKRASKEISTIEEPSVLPQIESASGSGLCEISSRPTAANGVEDSYDFFGRYIASMLRGIGPPVALRLQQEITCMLTNAMCAPPEECEVPVDASELTGCNIKVEPDSD